MLQVCDIVVSYQKDIWILKGVSLQARSKSITAVIGPNGAGKSTLLKTIYGYLKPAKGQILFQDINITSCSPQQALSVGIAYVPQWKSLFPEMTVKENLELSAWIFRHDSARLRRAINRVFEHFPVLKSNERKLAMNLSGGQQRMLELGRAFLLEPSLLMIDEPTVGLAPKIARDVYKTILELNEAGYTVILVDQNVKQGIDVSDYVYVLEAGQNSQEGSKKQFLEESSLVKSWLSI